MKISRYSAGFVGALASLAIVSLTMFCFSSEAQITFEECKKLGFPILNIETENHKAIKQKDKYLDANFSLEKILNGGGCKIRGHGNSTWKNQFTQKKPYLLKLDKEESLLGMSPSRKWILIANAFDRAMLRNYYTEYLTHNVFDKMLWNPRSQYVTLFLNGKYMGLYSLTEKIALEQNRINVAESSFLAEIDSHKRDNTVSVESEVNFSIREPDDATKENYEKFGNILRRLDSMIYSEISEEEFEKFFDLDSFVDWYLVEEFSKNHDGAFYNSCYMTFDAGKEKMYMGPVWDSDIAFGNTAKPEAKDPEGFFINKKYWYQQLFEKDWFVEKAKSRWTEKSQDVKKSIDWLEAQGEKLTEAAELNDEAWHILGGVLWPRAPGCLKRKTYKSEVDFLASWCRERADWLDKAFAPD